MSTTSELSDTGGTGSRRSRGYLITTAGALVGGVVLALAGIAIGAAYGKFMTTDPGTMREGPFTGGFFGFEVGEIVGSYIVLRIRRMERAGITALLVGAIMYVGNWTLGLVVMLLLNMHPVTYLTAAAIVFVMTPLLARSLATRRRPPSETDAGDHGVALRADPGA